MAGRPRKIRPTEGGSESSVPAEVSGGAGGDQKSSLAQLPAHYREHPDKLSGQDLRDLAHRQGLARSEMATMSDEKIRDQLKYLAYRRASETQ